MKLCKLVLLGLTLMLTAVPALAADAPSKASANLSESYQAFLKQFPTGVMTTVDGDQPRTRIFQFLSLDGDKYYFCTGSTKDVYKQLQKNKKISFCTWDPATSQVLSLDGPVTFVEDKALKQRLLDENPGIKGIYKSGDNPEFVVFYLEPTSIYSFDFKNGKQFIKK